MLAICGKNAFLMAVAVSLMAATANITAEGKTESESTGSFTVQRGYLSASVLRLVDSHGWSLIWDSEEDRVIDRPFVVSNLSLEDGLTNLLSIYKGVFVADIYAGNRVVHISTAQPGIEITLPADAPKVRHAERPSGRASGQPSTIGKPRPVKPEAEPAVVWTKSAKKPAAPRIPPKAKPAAPQAEPEARSAVARTEPAEKPAAAQTPPKAKPAAPQAEPEAKPAVARTEPAEKPATAQATPKAKPAVPEADPAVVRTKSAKKPAVTQTPTKAKPETKPTIAQAEPAKKLAAAQAKPVTSPPPRVELKAIPGSDPVEQDDLESTDGPIAAVSAIKSPDRPREESSSQVTSATSAATSATPRAREDKSVAKSVKSETVAKRDAPKDEAGRKDVRRSIQVLSTRDRKKAKTQFNLLRSKGYSAYFESFKQNGNTWYRVRVFPTSKDEFSATMDELAGLGYKVWTFGSARR